MASFPNLTLIEHPLVQHKLTLLRSRATSEKNFRELVDEISTLMAYEVTRDLPTDAVEVETPLEATTGRTVTGRDLTLVPILRAGLGMVEGVLRLIPDARVGHVGLYRNEESLEPVPYYFKMPRADDARDFIVLDPMLATGGSAAEAVRQLVAGGANRVRLMCIVAAPEGVRRMLERHPDVPVFTAALDRQLDANGYILPGLGDAGDRLFGTR